MNYVKDCDRVAMAEFSISEMLLLIMIDTLLDKYYVGFFLQIVIGIITVVVLQTFLEILTSV